MLLERVTPPGSKVPFAWSPPGRISCSLYSAMDECVVGSPCVGRRRSAGGWGQGVPEEDEPPCPRRDGHVEVREDRLPAFEAVGQVHEPGEHPLARRPGRRLAVGETVNFLALPSRLLLKRPLTGEGGAAEWQSRRRLPPAIWSGLK